MGMPKRTRTKEEEARVNSATKRVVVRLIAGQWDVEFDVADGEHIISPRELNRIKQAIHVRYGQYRRKHSLSQRMETRLKQEKADAENPAIVAESAKPRLVSEIKLSENDILLTNRE